MSIHTLAVSGLVEEMKFEEAKTEVVDIVEEQMDDMVENTTERRLEFLVELARDAIGQKLEPDQLDHELSKLRGFGI